MTPGATNKDTSSPNFTIQETIGIFILVFVKIIYFLLTTLTRFYPFSLFFTKQWFHIDRIGAYRIINIIEFANYEHNSRFTNYSIEKNNYFFMIYIEFKQKPYSDLWGALQRLAEYEDLEIRYCGIMEDGRHKVIAPVDQKWWKFNVMY